MEANASCYTARYYTCNGYHFYFTAWRYIGAKLDKAFLLGNAATLETSDIISTYVYRTGILGGGFSYASAIDLSMAVISLIFIYSANKVSRKVGETSLW